MPRFEFQLIAADDVLRVLRSLPGGKSCGLDLIPNELLKLTGSVISLSLADLFNTSLSSGVFQDQWKESVIAPALKDGKDATQPVSYRPIALLSCLSNVFERLVHERLLTYCLEHGFLPDQQFGSLRGRSTEWQLLAALENWHVVLHHRHHIHCVFLDAAKSFDRVDHSVLPQDWYSR